MMTSPPGLEDEGQALKQQKDSSANCEVTAAIRAVHNMLRSPDFDRRMLLLATQISHQSEMKAVLLSVLEALLKTLKAGDSGEVVVEAMTLIRCIIRLALGLLVEPVTNKTVLIDTVVNHFQTGT